MFGIGLHTPKNPINVGHVLRAADAFGASFVAIRGNRVASPTNVSSAEKRIPVLRGLNLKELIPYGCVPVAVELVDGAENLVSFQHPQQAIYIFGAEDATLGEKTLSWCKHKIFIPTRICLNLAACVNVVLYDRMTKC